MTPSELNRKLLFHGYEEVTDYLKDSPLNRYLYKRLLGVISAIRIDVPVVKLFNEIYYQCVRVNYDNTPGGDIERLYLKEEEEQLRSSEGAQLVFCVVWALLNVKRTLTFHEECFLRGVAPLLRKSALHSLAEELPGELLSNNLSVPECFPAMTCPISEVDMLWDKSLISRDYYENSRKYRELIASIKRKYHKAWKEVTGGYSPSIVEKYVRLYFDQEDQLKLIGYMKTGLTEDESSKCSPFFRELELRIKTGGFDLSDNLSIQSVVMSDTDTESDEEHRIHLSLDEADGDDAWDLARQYMQERDALKSELEEMRKSHDMELARMEAQHRAVIKELKKENDKLIRWPSKKKADGLKSSKSNTNVLMLNLDEVADHVKKRFSKSGAEEVCSMLYHLAVEHGALAEETLRQIDSIVPAILKRNTPHQIFELSNVSQFNNNPGTVVNNS